MSSPSDIVALASGMSEDQFAALPAAERRLLLLEMEYFAKEKAKNPLAFFIPNGKQEEFITAVGNMYETGKLIFVNAAANGTGKTVSAIQIVGNLIFGAQNQWFNRPTFRRPWLFPKRIWYHSEASSFQSKISPGITEWFPPGRYDFIKAGRKFNSHLEANGWTMDFLTYDQDVTSFESADVGVHLFDEPPPQEIRNACVARLRSGGIEIYVMTALDGAAWMYDEIIEKPEQRDRVFYMEADIESACKIHGVRGHLEHERIVFLVSQYDEDQREARLTGKPKHLQGKIYRTLHPTFHRHERLAVDFPQASMLANINAEGYVIYCGMDVHDARPPAIIWWAAGFDGHNYVVDEFPNNYDPEIEGNDPAPYHQIKSTTLNYEKIAAIIKYKEKKNGWLDPKSVRRVMDPNFGLKKSGESGNTVQQIIATAGQKLQWPMFFDATVSDDIVNGHAAVRVLLATDPVSGRPWLQIGAHCANMMFQALRYSRRKPSAKRLQADGPSETPAKKYKDFPDCYDDQTQILTERHGWRYFCDLVDGEKVATLGKYLDLEYQNIEEIISHRYLGKMIVGKSRGVDFVVTPNHRMLVYPQGMKLRARLASSLLRQDTVPVRSFGVRLKSPKKIEVWPGHFVDDGDWAEFIGWYVSEGHASGSRGQILGGNTGRGYEVGISQSTNNADNVIRISCLLDRLKFPYRYSGSTFYIYKRLLWRRLMPLGNSEEKYIPRDVLLLSRHCLLRLWESMVLGDGWESNGRRLYSTTSKCLADDTQELLARLGFASSITRRPPQNSIIHGRKIYGKHDQYCVGERMTWGAALTNGKKETLFKEVDYDGMVYCVRVPNQSVLVRRNNLPIFSGNSIRYTAMYYVRPKRSEVVVKPTPDPNPLESDRRPSNPEGVRDWRDWRPSRPIIPDRPLS